MNRRASHAFTGATLLLDGSMREQLRLTWRLMRDERVTALKFGLPALVALYVASPVDPIPDFLLGIGQMDDLGVVTAALVLLVRIIPRLAPADVVREHLQQMSRGGPPGSRSDYDSDHAVDASYRVRNEGWPASGS